MRRSLWIAALCASVAFLGACTSSEDEAGSGGPTLSAAAESSTREAFEGCRGFSDEEVVLIEDYVDAWNAHDVDAVMALFFEDDFTDPDEPNEATYMRCGHEAAFDAGVYIRIDFDSCLGQYVDADGQDVATGGGEYLELPLEVCGAACDWTFRFTDDGQLWYVDVPGLLTQVDAYKTAVNDAGNKCVAEAAEE